MNIVVGNDIKELRKLHYKIETVQTNKHCGKTIQVNYTYDTIKLI